MQNQAIFAAAFSSSFFVLFCFSLHMESLTYILSHWGLQSRNAALSLCTVQLFCSDITGGHILLVLGIEHSLFQSAFAGLAVPSPHDDFQR